MPTVDEVLEQDQEEYPEWLQQAEAADNAALADFFTSRVVYYPGSGTHGKAISSFGASHSAHCFVHIDQTVTSQDVSGELDPNHEYHCDGYTPISQFEFTTDQLVSILQLDQPLRFAAAPKPDLQSALLTILGRNQDRPHEHGPERLAFLHIHAEAIWTCWNIWGTTDPDPFAVLLKDHGFGGNWTTFGRADGALYQVAQQTTVFPKYLLVAEGTEEWPNYEAVSELTELSEGQRHRLFRRSQFDDRLNRTRSKR